MMLQKLPRHMTEDEVERLDSMVRDGSLVRRLVMIAPGDLAPVLDPVGLPIPPAGHRWETDAEHRERLARVRAA